VWLSGRRRCSWPIQLGGRPQEGRAVRRSAAAVGTMLAGATASRAGKGQPLGPRTVPNCRRSPLKVRLPTGDTTTAVPVVNISSACGQAIEGGPEHNHEVSNGCMSYASHAEVYARAERARESKWP
jgi:hypothetical protein